jgi:hypothetical protein
MAELLLNSKLWDHLTDDEKNINTGGQTTACQVACGTAASAGFAACALLAPELENRVLRRQRSLTMHAWDIAMSELLCFGGCGKVGTCGSMGSDSIKFSI